MIMRCKECLQLVTWMKARIEDGLRCVCGGPLEQAPMAEVVDDEEE